MTIVFASSFSIVIMFLQLGKESVHPTLMTIPTSDAKEATMPKVGDQ